MKKNIVAIIQARVGSTRLPNKVLLWLGNKTVLENVVDRVKMSKNLDKVVVATTTKKQDDKIIKICQKRNYLYFRGSDRDVLDRYYQAAKKHSADHIVRITGDCPLIDFQIINQVIKKHFQEQNDYTTNAYIETYPDGQDVEIFSFKSLREAWRNANLLSEREHPTKYITNHPEKYQIGNLAYVKNLSDKRWVLDEPEDYLFLKAIFKIMGSRSAKFSMEDVLSYLKKNPQIEKLNHHIIRNAGYLKSLKKDRQHKNQ